MANEAESWMWEQALQLIAQADRLERRFFALRSACRTNTSWEPPFDMFETDETLWILVAMPGVDPDQVDVTFDGRTLQVSGERSLPRPLKGALVHRLEIPWGRLERRMDLPAGRFRLARKELSLGCLVLGLEKL